MATYTDSQLKLIQELRKAGYDWETIATRYNTQFSDDKTGNAIRKTFKRYDGEDLSDSAIVKNMESARKKAIENSRLKKEQNVILDQQLTFKDVIATVEKLISSTNFTKHKPAKVRISKHKKKMVIEPLISDVHFGLKTKSYDPERARRAMRKMAETTIKEAQRNSKNYAIDKFNILFNGDLIQSATMHRDSHASCCLTNAEQLAMAIESLYQDFILPIAMTGHKVEIIGMCGNHDREASERFTVNPGKTYYTYTIYRALELLCSKSGLKNVKFIIPTESYHIYTIFDSNFLLEHGDALKGCGLKTLEEQINKRGVQESRLIKGIRIGHFHNDTVGNIGRYIINGSPVSDDHYGNLLGYKSRPCQIINYYVESDRDTSYYHSLVVNLEGV